MEGGKNVNGVKTDKGSDENLFKEENHDTIDF